MSNDEMLEGYRDGFNAGSPEPSANRSHAYHHGFANGRDDLNRSPRDTAANFRKMAAEAIQKDAAA